MQVLNRFLVMKTDHKLIKISKKNEYVIKSFRPRKKLFLRQGRIRVIISYCIKCYCLKYSKVLGKVKVFASEKGKQHNKRCTSVQNELGSCKFSCEHSSISVQFCSLFRAKSAPNPPGTETTQPKGQTSKLVGYLQPCNRTVNQKTN